MFGRFVWQEAALFQLITARYATCIGAQKDTSLPVLVQVEGSFAALWLACVGHAEAFGDWRGELRNIVGLPGGLKHGQPVHAIRRILAFCRRLFALL